MPRPNARHTECKLRERKPRRTRATPNARRATRTPRRQTRFTSSARHSKNHVHAARNALHTRSKHHAHEASQHRSRCLGSRVGVFRHELSKSPGDENAACSEDIAVASIVKHPAFNTETRENDVAVLKLATPAACAEATNQWGSANADYVPSMIIALDGSVAAGGASVLDETPSGWAGVGVPPTVYTNVKATVSGWGATAAPSAARSLAAPTVAESSLYYNASDDEPPLTWSRPEQATELAIEPATEHAAARRSLRPRHNVHCDHFDYTIEMHANDNEAVDGSFNYGACRTDSGEAAFFLSGGPEVYEHDAAYFMEVAPRLQPMPSALMQIAMSP